MGNCNSVSENNQSEQLTEERRLRINEHHKSQIELKRSIGTQARLNSSHHGRMRTNEREELFRETDAILSGSSC